MKILLLEDDVILNEIIEEFLLTLNYEVVSTHDGEIAEELIYEELYDLLIFDVNVPSLNGFALLEKLRNNNINIPTIFITSLNTIEDLQTGFKVGCDDYIKKPFELTELNFVIKNMMKLSITLSNNVIKLSNGIYLDKKNMLIKKDKKIFSLPRKEYEILSYLIKKKDIVNIKDLHSNIWRNEKYPGNSTIRTYIKNLRKILGKEYILNKRGYGYKFNN